MHYVLHALSLALCARQPCECRSEALRVCAAPVSISEQETAAQVATLTPFLGGSNWAVTSTASICNGMSRR